MFSRIIFLVFMFPGVADYLLDQPFKLGDTLWIIWWSTNNSSRFPRNPEFGRNVSYVIVFNLSYQQFIVWMFCNNYPLENVSVHCYSIFKHCALVLKINWLIFTKYDSVMWNILTVFISPCTISWYIENIIHIVARKYFFHDFQTKFLEQHFFN